MDKRGLAWMILGRGYVSGSGGIFELLRGLIGWIFWGLFHFILINISLKFILWSPFYLFIQFKVRNYIFLFSA